ncbi:MAG: GNAT family N-acetyltransferase, partial [Treponema sp.]|nr:GNAT family N-acetyltransferase [Treponema sp.]
MNLFPAQPFDIDSIMKIERQAFIPQIQEKKKTFEKRLEIFPNGFLILSDASETAVKQNGNAVTCGYLCSEIWSSFPSAGDSDDVFMRKFKLGHNIKDTHDSNGRYLYISSFAILRDYQGKGLGKRFFENALAALCGSFRNVEKVVLIVNEEWKGAIKIYKSLGFEEVRTLKDFFPTLG